MTTARAVCVVPGCSNSSAKFAGHRYICGPHWRRIPRAQKRFDRQLLRAFVIAGFVRGEEVTNRDARRALDQSWYLLERAAIEGAAGL